MAPTASSMDGLESEQKSEREKKINKKVSQLMVPREIADAKFCRMSIHWIVLDCSYGHKKLNDPGHGGCSFLHVHSGQDPFST